MLHAAHQKCSIPHQKASKHPKWSYCLSLTHAISTSDTNGSSAAGDFPKTWQQLKPTLNNIEFFGHMHAAQSFRYSLKHKSFFSPALTAAKPGQTGVTAVKFLQFCMAARFSLGGGRRRAMKKDLTWTNKLHKLNNEEFGRWSPVLDSESIRPYARHWEDTGKGGIIPSGRDMCTPSGIRRRLGSGHKPLLSATTWCSRYSSPANLSAQAPLRYVVLPVWQVPLLQLSQSRHKRFLSPFSLARGQLLTTHTSYFQTTGSCSSKIDIVMVLCLFITLTF